MIGPSLTHTGLVLGLQWATALPFIWHYGMTAPTVSGAFFAGLWLGREFEQLWPHFGLKPLPEGTTVEDWNRFIRQGLWPLAGVLAALFIVRMAIAL